MVRQKIDRTGEEGVNNFGSKMIIVRYRRNDDVDIYFPEYNWTAKNTTYDNFKRGEIKCPYEPRVYGKGYIGEGKYKAGENGKMTKYYNTWHSMLRRCYDSKSQEKHPTYKGCYVEYHFHNFQNMGEWLDENYYEVSGEKMALDKDILKHGNKVYSRDTCLIVPERINSLFTYKQKKVVNHNLPHGITPNGNVYKVRCYDGNNKRIYLGAYKTIEEAFDAYKEFRESVIKQVAYEYYSKGLIPKKVYDALYNYKVLITD